ncbi:MAG: cyclic nucleotide-binding domain-containing protein [Actinobacteria bacterium]|nr:cyclic nucleotide-binding domain-containing protein [Actinomycetota bacterium]
MSTTWDTKLARLGEVPLFEGCDRREVRAIGRLGDLTTRPAGTVLTREGRWGGEALVIVDGVAIVTYRGRSVADLGAGDVVGVVAALHPGAQPTTVTATTEVELLVFDPRAFRSLLELVPVVARRILTQTTGRLAAA